MPRYRIYRMKEGPKEHFRWACHTGGLALVKAKDYEPGEEREAANPYELWKAMSGGAEPLQPGDLLENLAAPGELVIAKYVGFEPAQWFIPEPKPAAAPL